MEKVSALMPTCNRRGFIQRSIQCFLNQICDFETELIILDDGSEPVIDIIPPDSRIHYHYELPKKNHGEKMNRCAELSQGDYLIVWDDDDIYSSDRIRRQIAPFYDPKIMLTGTSRLYYYLHGTQQAYRYHNFTSTAWLASFAIRRSVWEAEKFQPIPAGADTKLIASLPADSRYDLNDLSLMVATIHSENASVKTLPNASFIETPWKEIESIFRGTTE